MTPMAAGDSGLDPCPECEGRGWVIVADGGAGTAQPCDCQQDLLVPRLLAAAGIPRRYAGKNFRNFNTRHGDPAEQDQRLQALSMCRQYVEGFLEDRERSLLLVGEAGVGKTHLAVAILTELIRRYRVRGRFVDFTELIHRIQSTFDPSSPQSKHEVLDPVAEAELLVLDELGAQKPSEWVREILYLVINTRYTKRLPTVFTTNFSLGSEPSIGDEARRGAVPLRERIGAPLVSRLHEMALTLPIRTKDFRHDAKRVRAHTF